MVSNAANMERVEGVYAALITPVEETGTPDPETLGRLVEFVIGAGVDGVCVGGGTGEYPHFSLEQRMEIVSIVARQVGDRLPIVVSIGAPTVRDAIELGRDALDRGARALLLPMPYFYRYSQEDLTAYSIAVAQSLEAPVLLYNLPAFTNPIETDTALNLMSRVPNIAGQKDSSGNAMALKRLVDGRGEESWSLLCGADGLALGALEAGWNGIISGIASCCPELLVAVYRHFQAGRMDEARRCQRLLDELVESVARLPFPWSIRVAAEVRTYSNGPFPMSPSMDRQRTIADLRIYYMEWFARHLPTLDA